MQHAQRFELCTRFSVAWGKGWIDEQKLFAVGVESYMLECIRRAIARVGDWSAAKIDSPAFGVADHFNDIRVMQVVRLSKRMGQCRHGQERILAKGYADCPDRIGID